MINRTLKWKYENTALLALSLVALVFIMNTDVAQSLIGSIGNFGYFGAFVAGIFFTSTFTVAPSSLVLFHLAGAFNPILIALYSGAGAVIGDLIIFNFLKDGVFEELRPFFKKFKGPYLDALARTPYFAWLVPVVGAIIIASPFPDEVGIALMGLSKIKTWQFVILVFALNAVGIFFIVTIASIV